MTSRLAETLLCLAAALAVTQQFQLLAVPEFLDLSLTPSATLECRHEPSTSTSIVEVHRVRVDKQTAGGWTLVAELLDYDPQAHVTPGVTAWGQIGSPDVTFLKVSWNSITSEILGVYRCELVGMDAADDFVVEKTPTVSFKESGLSSAVVAEMIRNQTAPLQQALDDFKSHTRQEMSDIINIIRENQIGELNLITSLQMNLSSQISSLVQKVEELDARVTVLEQGVTSVPATTTAQTISPTVTMVTDTTTATTTATTGNLVWPEGTYGLYEPNTSCPENTGQATWFRGYRRHHTVSGQNLDEISPNGHMATPVMQTVNTDHYFYQRFCMVDMPSTGPAWPRGSYCINRKGGACPAGFNSGFIFIDDNGSQQDQVSGSVPDGTYTTDTQIYYCCRNDSTAQEAIDLPTGKPFYLYRFGRECQLVAGMSERREWILIDTANGANHDRYENDWHPDGSIQDIRIQLCYYTSQ
ncbi:uncharacterized protein LOC131944557 [Physella acuta]|uniref:uncharacterized protein LOC131944557 n=1 Tax=Physella acuta TaxID=109671 RepID=UPI0027DDDE12|nr:uncharacterized protein LOC131944557 [Physella acuta]